MLSKKTPPPRPKRGAVPWLANAIRSLTPNPKKLGRFKKEAFIPVPPQFTGEGDRTTPSPCEARCGGGVSLALSIPHTLHPVERALQDIARRTAIDDLGAFGAGKISFPDQEAVHR